MRSFFCLLVFGAKELICFSMYICSPGITTWPPAFLSEDMFAVTPKSTGELLLRHCLKQFNIQDNPTNVVMVPQDQVIERLTSTTNGSSYGVLWAPNTYTYRQDNGKAQVFLLGQDRRLSHLRWSYGT